MSWRALEKLAVARGLPLRRPPAALRVAVSDGLKLNVLDWEGGPNTLILLHGGGLCAHSFDLLALALGPQVRCLSLDLRGHGLSDWSDDYRVERHAADVVEIFDALAPAGGHLAGMSLGGCVAGHAAAHLGALVRSLTFIDVGPQVNFGSTRRMREFMADALPAPSLDAVVAAALAVSPRTDPDLMRYRYRGLLVSRSQGVDWRADRRRPPDFGGILAQLARLNQVAAQIHCPTLVVKGGRSRVLTWEATRRFAAAFPDGRPVLVEGAGHNVQEDRPAELAAAMRPFIRTESLT